MFRAARRWVMAAFVTWLLGMAIAALIRTLLGDLSWEHLWQLVQGLALIAGMLGLSELFMTWNEEG